MGPHPGVERLPVFGIQSSVDDVTVSGRIQAIVADRVGASSFNIE